MTATETVSVQASEPNEFGYRDYDLGGFLRALQRDVAWDFFYGTVNFDNVVGTVNHYGTVDLFAGRYNDAYRKAELDHVENFSTDLIKATFQSMLDDWTNAE